MLEVHGNP